ncbi:MAG: penicillin-binding protein 2 [Lachnospiraceae bacterium]|nr:penicillin-binding protein 2 [Lachnospiraceae bacterium]
MLHDKEEAINNSFNPRQELLASQNIRGSIYSADGEVLAKTRVLEDGTEQRYYPYQNLFAHVVGYSTKGKTGIEFSENMKMLTSHASLSNKIQNELNAEKNIGDSVITTLDVSLQQVAYDTLGVYSGVIVVTQPSTGKILAMVSKPDYDPNEIATIWEDLVEDDSSSVLLNRATQGLYPPGSTFKIVTALEYYRQNQKDVSGYYYSCGGSFSKDGNTIRCYHGQNHGSVDFTRSFAKSCNSSFANIGTSLDIVSFQNTCRDLLFNSELKLELPYKQSRFMLTTSDVTDTVMQTSIGQGKTQITPMHLNMITAAIANQGVCMTPYVVDRIESATGSVVKRNSPSQETVMMTEEEAAFMTKLMTEVVLSGTASKLDGLSYTAAGKTGSAEFSENKLDSHAWFTGFAPAENPQVCVTVIVESAGSGGDYAVPIAKRVFDEFFGKN